MISCILDSRQQTRTCNRQNAEAKYSKQSSFTSLDIVNMVLSFSWGNVHTLEMRTPQSIGIHAVTLGLSGQIPELGWRVAGEC